MIRYTIITCTYNAEGVLQRTLDSIQEQTWRGIDHIIVDGKSNDGTLEMAEAYKSIMEKEEEPGRTVRIVSEPDRGLYDAMNKGLRMAEGDYVLFLNAGDCFHNARTLEEVSESFREFQKVSESCCFDKLSNREEFLPGVIYGDTDVVDTAGHYIGKREHQPPETLTWRSYLGGMMVCHQAFYARRDIAQRCQYDLRYKLSGDFDWCIRVMKEAEKEHLELVNTNMVVCNFLAGGLTAKKHKESLRERFNIMAKHYGVVSTIIAHIVMIKRFMLYG